MKQFSRRSGNYYQSNSNATRSALDRLKYTMTYIAVLPMISGPWWGIYGIYHDSILSSINGVNIFLSTMWHIGGAQPLIAVTQYILAKRVYQHYSGHIPSNELNSSSSSASHGRRSRSTTILTPTTPTLPVTPTSAVLKQDQRDRASESTIDVFYDMDSIQKTMEEERTTENIQLSPITRHGFPDWDSLEASKNSDGERNV